jgi:hypothetical protein
MVGNIRYRSAAVAGANKKAEQMKAIQTRYLGPTNVRGTRIKAFVEGSSITCSYDYGLDNSDNHVAAAQRLAAKLKWDYSLASGSLPNGDHCHVLLPASN